MAAHCWEHGLILRYPKDKQEVTQIAYEPWHFRYVGVPHAWYCWEQGLCLEEYLETLREAGGYEVELAGISWYVFYQTAENGMLSVPDDMSYEVSSDGTGGYVVTAWK
jgi:D-alanyl-D-alanine carboxypeptidase